MKKLRGRWLRLLVRARRRWRRFERDWRKATTPVSNVARRRLRDHAITDTWA